MDYKLRPYQTACLDALAEAQRRGVQRPLCVLPTGAGKTALFASYLAACPPTERQLILVHRDELIDQTIDKMAIWAPGLQAGIVKAESNDTAQRVTIASIQTVQREQRLAQLAPPQTIIVDEAHHCEPGNSWWLTMQRLRAFEADGPQTIGWTATPFRPNNAPIVGAEQPFQECAYVYSLPEAITEGYLVGIDNKHIFIELNLDKVKQTAGDWSAEALGDAMLDADAPSAIVEAWLTHARGKRTLVFTPNIAMAKATEEAFADASICVASIFGHTPREERHEIYSHWRQGTIDVVVNVMVLTEGFDEPSVECIVLARPTRSKVLYMQAVGRGLRPYPGKESCLILDCVGACHRHELMSLAALYGLAEVKESPPDEEQADEDSAMDEEESENEGAMPLLQAQRTQEGALRAVELSLYRRSPMPWVQTQKGAHVLSLRDGILRLRCIDLVADKWSIEYRKADRSVQRLATNLPLVYAQGVAEDTAREHGDKWLLQPGAAWRRSEPSVKQQQFAQKIGLQPALYPTKGQLSDAITSITGDW